MSLTSTLTKMKSRGAFAGKSLPNADVEGPLRPNKVTAGRLKKKLRLPAKDKS